MIILLSLILLLNRSSSSALPFSASQAGSFIRDNATLPESPAACTCPNLRSIWDIIWSCLATIFACSWVSVHPDIPALGQSQRHIALRRLEYMIWTILTPEMIILWAARQWFGAREIANTDYGPGRKWTRTHGHFLQMGGFELYKGKEPRGVLSHPRFKYLLENGRITFPEITEEEILDRSKSDGLSKILVVGQTTWFILQCIVRNLQDLHITELELATLAFAVLNVFMYIFWWDKPFDVRTSIPVQLLESRHRRIPSLPELLEHDVSAGYKQVDTTESTPASSKKTAIHWMWRVIEVISLRLHSLKENVRQIQEFERYYDHLPEIEIDIDYTKLMQVPPYYARMTNMEDERMINIFIAVIGMVFGGIHCGGWLFLFPSCAELWIWRSCSVLISGVPICYIAAKVLWKTKEYIGYGLFYDVIQQMYNNFRLFFSYVCVPLYILARLVLVVEVFVALRDMPQDVYIDISWVAFIPHV